MLLFLVKSRTWDLVCQQHHCKIIHLSYLPPWQQSFDWLIWSQTTLTFTFTFHIWHNRKQNIGCTYIFHRKKAKVMHQILMMMSRHDLWKIMLGHYVWGQFLSDQNLNSLKNRSNIVILCIYSVSQPKKRENVKKIQFLANDIMLGHLPFKWLLETGEAKTCKLDQYAYRSCWDISLRDFNQNLMEVKPEKSQI